MRVADCMHTVSSSVRVDRAALLERFLPRAETPGRVLVPLCGKSADLAWLAEQGYSVTGVDLSEIAARAFFTENSLQARVTEEPPFRVFSGERIVVYVGDFFDLNVERFGVFDLVYDRAALIALSDKVRPQYASAGVLRRVGQAHHPLAALGGGIGGSSGWRIPGRARQADGC